MAFESWDGREILPRIPTDKDVVSWIFATIEKAAHLYFPLRILRIFVVVHAYVPVLSRSWLGSPKAREPSELRASRSRVVRVPPACEQMRKLGPPAGSGVSREQIG